MRLLAKLLIVAITIAASPNFSDHIVVDGFGAALLAAVVYGLLFVLLGWLVGLGITLLSIVPGILTLGLFFLLIPTLVGTVLLKMTAGLVGSFEIRTWGAAFLLALVLGLVNWLFEGRDRERAA